MMRHVMTCFYLFQFYAFSVKLSAGDTGAPRAGVCGRWMVVVVGGRGGQGGGGGGGWTTMQRSSEATRLQQQDTALNFQFEAPVKGAAPPRLTLIPLCIIFSGWWATLIHLHRRENTELWQLLQPPSPKFLQTHSHIVAQVPSPWRPDRQRVAVRPVID